MTTAEKLQEVYENSEKVKELNDELESILYGTDTGGKSYYDAFWDVFQRSGERTYYQYAFAYDNFTDDNYNPKYDIICANSTSAGYNLFRGSDITDTKVSIHFKSGCGANAAFYDCPNLVTIKKLVVEENVGYANMFYQTKTVENITIEGVIGRDFSIDGCSKLTKASIESIVGALSLEATGRTLSLSKTAVQNAFGTDYDSSTEWVTLKNSKANWTITLS